MFGLENKGFRAIWGLATLFVPLLLSCSSGEPRSLHLVDEPPASSTDPEAERLRKMQLIRALDTSTDPPTLTDASEYDIGLNIYFACNSERCFDTGGLTDECDIELCAAQAQLCQAKLYMAAAQPQSGSLKLGSWLIPPQTPGASARLAQIAMNTASTAMQWSVQPLNEMLKVVSTTSYCRPADAVRYGSEGTQYATAYAATYADAYHTFQEATQIGLKATNNAADAQFSSTTSSSLQQSRAVAGTALSRSAAAHLLTYGDAGLLGSTTKGFCATPSLTPSGKAALSVLRESAISPVALASGLTIDTLLNGVGSSVPNGSVRQRLAELYQYPALLSGTPVEQYYGLTQAAFTEARSFMNDEVNAFSRSLTAALPAVKLPGGASTTYPRFSATAGSPVALPSAYYSAVARYTQSTGFGFANPPFPYEDLGLDYWVDAGVSTAAQFLWGAANSTGLTLPADALSPLGLLVASHERIARLTFQNLSSTFTSNKVIVDGFSPSDGIRFLVGEDQLRCAVQGNIEGAPCTDIGLAVNQTNTAPYGFSSSTTLSPVTVAAGPKRIYIVRPKPGISLTTAVPGQYEALTGASVDTSHANTMVFAVVPAVEQQIADVLRPSRDWCARPQVSCAGTDFDERLPLENELSSDGDGVESSWKHYLQQAQTAAAQADQLGVDYINAGLENSQNLLSDETRREQQLERADDEIERLQTLCGTSLDPRQLLNTLVTGSTSAPDINKVTGIQCDPSAANTCPVGYSCNSYGSASAGGGAATKSLCTVDLAGLAASDNSGSPDLKRLADCLSDQQLTPFVSLGKSEVCLWYSNANPNLLCQGATTQKCPALSNGTGCATQLATLPTGVTATKSKALNFFDTSSTLQSSQVCTAFRQLRKTPGAPGTSASGGAHLIDALVAGYPFDQIRMTAAADRLTFEMRYGGYAAIDLDGTPIYQTGNAFLGGPNTTAWPCSTAGMPAECTGPTPSGAGLLCQSFDCADPTQRMNANYTMLKAVLAAKTIGHQDDNFALGQGLFQHSILDESGWGSIASGAASDILTFTGPANAVIRTSGTDMVGYQVSANSTDVAGIAWYQPTNETGNVYTPRSIRGYDWRETQRLVAHRNCNGKFDSCELHPGFDLIRNDAWDPWVVQRLRGASTADLMHQYEFGSRKGTDKPVQGDFDSLVGGFVWETLGQVHVRGEDQLNGYELLCGVQAGDLAPTVSLTAPPVVTSVADLSRVAQYIQLVARQIKDQAGTRVFANIPAIAISALTDAGGDGAYPQYSGDMGAALAQLRGGLTRLQETIPQLSNEVAGFGYDLQTLHDTLTVNNNNAQIADLQMWSNISNQLAACASTVGVGSFFSGATAATCANAVAQIAIGTKINKLQVDDTRLQSSISLQDFGTKFSSHATNMQTLALHFSEASEDVDASLATIEGLRAQAKVSLARALDLASYQASNSAAVTQVLGNLYDAKQIRYKQALGNAQRMAFLAKRAIEQRLGVRLSDLTEPLPLVDAPASWEATGCTTGGIDYSALTVPQDPSLASSGGAQQFADGFIGDYVTKLSNVVESYQLVNNFHEGTDTAIISLRDDVIDVRAPCDVPSPNLLYYTSNLQQFGSPGWAEESCTMQTVDGVQVPAANCVTVNNAGTIPNAVLPDPALARASAFQLKFGTAAAATSKLDQTINLPSGLYRFSWYTPDVAGASAGFVSAGSGIVTQVATTSTTQVANTWGRRYITFSVASDGASESMPVTVGFARLSASTTDFTVAGPMLERLPGVNQDYALAPFVGTDGSLTTTLPACEDTSGAVFRASAWQVGCERLCADGYASQCDDSNAKSYCYHQASFGINQRDIQLGKVLNFSGFARGNFNYRIDSLALNFVGTGINDCSTSDSPTACAGAGFVPYSLAHVGPFYVRNYRGDDFEAHLFDGNIEHARGLSTERYITNPISSSDQSLIDQYMRAEFQGRPLDGNFVIKVWDGDGTKFDAIQDVQLVLKYRYWTRFN